MHPSRLLMAEITAQLRANNIEYFVHTLAQADEVDTMVDIILRGNSSSVLVFLYVYLAWPSSPFPRPVSSSLPLSSSDSLPCRDSAETHILLARAAQIEFIAQSTLAWTILPSAGDLALLSEHVRTVFDRQIFTANRQIPTTAAARSLTAAYMAFDAGLDQSALPLTTVERSVVDAVHLLYVAADNAKYVFGLGSDVLLTRRTLTSAISTCDTTGLLQDPLRFNQRQELESQLDLQVMVSGRWISLAR